MLKFIIKLIICVFYAFLGYSIMNNKEQQQLIKINFVELIGIGPFLVNNREIKKLYEKFILNIYYILLLTPLIMLGKYFNFEIIFTFISSLIVNFSLNFDKNNLLNPELYKNLLFSCGLLTCFNCSRNKN